ncbi:hypothetical protein D3C85_1542090 [compost metagenome]
MSGHRVNRLDFTAKTREATGIDQGQVGFTQPLAELRSVNYQANVRLAAEGTFTLGRRVQAQRQSGRMPGFQATIKNRHAATFAEPGQ